MADVFYDLDSGFSRSQKAFQPVRTNRLIKVEAPSQSLDPITPKTLPHPLVLANVAANARPAAPHARSGHRDEWPATMDWFLVGLSILVLIAAVLYRPKTHEVSQPTDEPASGSRVMWVDRLAQKLTDPQLITFDRISIAVLLLSAAIFLIFCLLGWHGSSTAKWDVFIANESARTGLIWGEAKAVRIDEFGVFTPDTFSQVFSQHRFAAENPVVGGGKSVLFWSWPVNHFIEIPRFYLWPFHVLPIDKAFSVYWNLKGLILFAGAYLLMLLLTGSRPLLSAAGAVWIYFSGMVQWWYSHCLPECIGFGCLILVAGAYVLLTRKRGLLFLAAPVLVVSLLDFALIFYPPFGVPIMWAMLGAGLGFFIEKRRLLFGSDHLKIRWVVLAGCAVICGSVFVAFFLDARDTIQMIFATEYPGRRFYSGGDATLMSLFLSLIDPVFKELHIPRGMGNVCDSGIYLGGLLALPMIFFAPRGTPRFSATDVTLALTGLGMCVFLLFGFPHFLAGATLLSMTILNRAKPGLGLVAVFLLMRHFARQGPGSRRIQAMHWQVALPLSALLALLFVQFLRASGYVIPMRTVAMLVSVNFGLVLFIVAGRPVPFFAVMLPFLLMHNFLINPIAKGFEAVTGKNLYRAVRELYISDPTAKWVVFGPAVIAEFIKFTGADVINGTQIYPVFAYHQILDPTLRSIPLWNRYAHLAFIEAPLSLEAEYEHKGLTTSVRLSARSPALDKIGVRYCVMSSPPPANYLSAVLKRVQDGRKSYWILRRDLIPTGTP